MLRKCCLYAIAAFIILTLSARIEAQQGFLISTADDQKQLLKAYRLILEKSSDDYHDATAVWDNELFPSYGEHSVYWITSGGNKGRFVYPGVLPDDYQTLTGNIYTHYSLSAQNQVSIQFKKHPKRIAIFKSKYKSEGISLTWESVYFERLFSEYLMDDVFYTVNEDSLTGKGIDSNTELLIIPAFVSKEQDYAYYIDSIFAVTSGLNTSLQSYIARGGSIYAEGNGVYFLQKTGNLEAGAITYPTGNNNNNVITVHEGTPAFVLGQAISNTGAKLFGAAFPVVNSSRISVIATSDQGNPCLFIVNPAHTSGSRIICNTGLPTVSGLSDNNNEISQINWTMAAILSAFTYEVDVTRKIRNDLHGYVTAGDNAISYDSEDTLVVEIRIRNLSDQSISDISVEEKLKAYFSFVEVTSGDSYSGSEGTLVFDGISVPAHSEKIITYTVSTPDPTAAIHDNIDALLDKGNLMAVSGAAIKYNSNGFDCHYRKSRDYADVLFSASIFADTDVNWKNFLNLEYQPFKVFMIMENKSRSPALNTTYTQYIPKDVPFYWSDNSINIPVLKTPGGKFVDVLKGSNDQNHPEYDMDSDGHPDVWLDTASIFPKGYTIIEDQVYWANPWNHLRTGTDDFAFEDIDHDGKVALDNNGDGIPDTEEPGDKIRVWKVTWDMGRVEGYEYHDPYSSYEIWVDPPDLVPLAAGVGYVHGSIPDPYPAMFYPYTQNIALADKNDTTWSHWMERDDDGNVIWKQLIHQKINNYEGFTFIDTADVNYHPLPTDSVIGTCPQPHREFLAVLSLGGEEIDMTHYAPQQSLYSKINYETVFGEDKVTPIRTTYTYWAPLPNPLQFEYLSNNYRITDTLDQPLDELPEYGKAKLVFDMDASTEYTYYWIRNFGYDVDNNDPSLTVDHIDALGDGVFGYFVYSIPKGMGGYQITLPQNEDGTYNFNEIVSIDNHPFTQWINNPNTPNNVEIWETPFEFQVYIPQVLIPPALDDNNFDGTDDWIDDRGDRFESKTGYLHDGFMPGNGEDYEAYPATPFVDDIYGTVNSGWYGGSDNAYGDDYFEDLGKTHIQIHANYLGKGREGTVEISKGGVLVAEEIFGGSPWVLFSHVLSGFAKGTDLSVKSDVNPEIVYYGVDTVYLKHIVADTNEPHFFDGNFDPYHISYGYGESTITTYVGAKDPCSLIEPAISMPAILDPGYDQHSITLVPAADGSNPDLTGYPRTATGTFLEVRIEVNNSTEDNWINTTLTPEIPAELGNTNVELSYVAYPRPLVPAQYDASSGKIIKGDQPGTFTSGWRFNQPESEVLIKMGSTLNLMQPTRRAYFVFLFKIDPTLKPGIYEIPFTLSGNRKHYTNVNHGAISYAVPNAFFCIADKNAKGTVTSYQPIILDHSALKNLDVSITGNFKPTGRIKWSMNDFEKAAFESVPGTLSMSAGTIDLSRFKAFPVKDTTQLVIMQEGIVDSYNTSAEMLRLTDGQLLHYTNTTGEKQIPSERLLVKPIGPRIRVKNQIYSINNVLVTDTTVYESDVDLYIKTRLTVKNSGSDISSNTVVNIHPGPVYEVITAELGSNCTYSNGLLKVNMGNVTPGEMKEQFLPFVIRPSALPKGVDIRTLISQSVIDYEGTLIDVAFNFTDTAKVLADLYDFEASSLSFNNIGNGQVQVSASVLNKGIVGKDVWVRIYPVIGGGAHEFPIAETRVEHFNPMQSIDLFGNYTLPVTDKSIEFIVIVDDDLDYVEVTELNNDLKVSYLASSTDNPSDLEQYFVAYPIPYKDEVHFEYTLKTEYQQVTMQVFDLSGKLWMEIRNCPGDYGINRLSWRNSTMPQGNYVYRITGIEPAERESLLYTGRITKAGE
jgi:hypothetical protein